MRRVIKLGGSLLDWPEWPARFRSWLAAQSPAVNILIGGGGALADEVRERDRIEHLDPSTAHWLAIDAMSENMAIVRRQLPEAMPVDRWEDLQRPFAPGDLIAFCPRDFLRRVESNLSGPKLPHSWDATSDSIAARLAHAMAVDELVLLKSAPQPHDVLTFEQLANIEYVDRCFPQFATRVATVRIWCLRGDSTRAGRM